MLDVPDEALVDCIACGRVYFGYGLGATVPAGGSSRSPDSRSPGYNRPAVE